MEPAILTTNKLLLQLQETRWMEQITNLKFLDLKMEKTDIKLSIGLVA